MTNSTSRQRTIARTITWVVVVIAATFSVATPPPAEAASSTVTFSGAVG